MDPKERASVAVREFHGRIHGDHISGHTRCIRTSLNPNTIKLYALQPRFKLDQDPFRRTTKRIKGTYDSKSNLDYDLGLHGPASTPENKREDSEEKEEPNNKGKEIVASRVSLLMIFGLEEAFFFDDIDLILPSFVGLVAVVVGVVELAGTGEAARGGLP